MVLRRIFGLKTEEETLGWSKLHIEELCYFYYSPDIIRMIVARRMRWEGHVACMGEMRNAYKILVGKCKGKRSHGRRNRICEDNFNVGIIGIGLKSADWINLAQDMDSWRVHVNTVMNLWVP
jgi:hypothetical protein